MLGIRLNRNKTTPYFLIIPFLELWSSLEVSENVCLDIVTNIGK
jgi:hypothetical protein